MITTTTPENPKYRAEYKSIDGDVLRLDIWDKDYTGQTIEIQGKTQHIYSERKDIFEPIIPSTLGIFLEANNDLTLSDLYSENERQFTVNFYRNDQIIFFGYLLPDGIWEDFVSDRWEVSLNAVDGLSILKNLSFVTDEGYKYSNKITQFTAVRQCLKRIGYELPINISNLLPTYEGFDSTDTVLKSVLINADRFYQDDRKRELMDCDEVLKSILELYNATVIQMHGEWWIFRAIDVKDEMTFYRYETGEKTGEIIWNAGVEIGSHIDRFEIFHCNANQKKSITPSTQAFRVNYKYGTVRSIYKNENFVLGEGLYADGWHIEGFNGSCVPQPDGKGVMFINDNIDLNSVPLWIHNTDIISIVEGDNLNVVFRLTSTTGGGILSYNFQTNNFVFTENGWVEKNTANQFTKINKSYPQQAAIAETFSLGSMPETGGLNIAIYITLIYVPDWGTPFNFDGIDVIPNASANLKGEFHTAQRLTRISSVTKNDKVVNNGDSVSDIYYGTLYKETGEPTTLWNRPGEVTAKPLLRIMVEDILRISPRPMYFFEGDVCGYYPYLAKVQINNVPGVFQVAKYNFDTVRNINRNTFREYATEYLIEGTDFIYEPTIDFGAVTKVTIVK